MRRGIPVRPIMMACPSRPATYLAGLALSNARLGVIHGLAHPLGARYHAAHGLVCGVLLPHVLEFNRDWMQDKYDRMCAALS